MLGEESPEEHKFSPEEVCTRLAAALGSHHEGNRLGGMSIVGGYASGNGSRKLTQQEISRGSCFGAIASKGENEHVNEANLVGMAPWLVGKSSGHRDGPPKPVIESRPAKRNKVPPEVPDRVADLDGGIGMDPELTAKLLPGGRTGAESVAFGWGSFGT